MSAKNTPRSRRPGTRLMLWANRLMVRRVRRTGRVAGLDALVLHTVGRKSGVERQTPVGWFPGADGGWLIVASAGGAPHNPAWYHNLVANPDKVQIETGGRKLAVTPEVLDGAERDAAWRQITTAAPRFAGYERKTERALPVIRLTQMST
jgi:deazaflavin-dependent oxidoreductase (nitroreductase family)